VTNDEPRWERQDLTRRLCHSLDVAAISLKRLASTGYRDAVEPSNSLPSEKLISETAMLLVAASGVKDTEAVAQRIICVAAQLIPHARSAKMRLGLCLRPGLAWDYGLAHICLQRLGHIDSEFDRLFRQAIRSQAAEGRERTPHRVLEIEWMRRMLGGSPTTMPDACSIASQQSALAHPMDLFGGTREDVYAFTHAIMYTADFNLQPASFPRPREALLAEAEAALARALDEEDYDIGGELLLAWPSTGTMWGASAAFGFRVLADVESAVGFLPVAATRIDRLNRLEGECRADYLTATAYHTVFVMGLLCAVALGNQREPPRHIPSQNSRPGSAVAILPYLSDSSRRRHWQDSLDRLKPGEVDAVSGLLLIIAFHRRIAAYDFEGVMRLLELAVSLGMSDTPAASQAAEMLHRVSLFAAAKDAPLPECHQIGIAQ
jgi:hypothetical protein